MFSFYMLSGYLMTYVLREVYGLSFLGIKRFLVNRFLRIYLTYWVVAVIVLLALIGFPAIGNFDVVMKIPGDIGHWLVNIRILGLLCGITEFHISGERLVSVAWSLHVELFFYISMAVFLVKNDKIILSWFVLSLLYTVYMVVSGYTWQDRYFTLAASPLPFSMGAILYLLYKKSWLPDFSKWILFFPLLFIVHWLEGSLIYGGSASEPMGAGFYVSLVLSFLTLSLLLGVVVSQRSFFYAIDTHLGDMTYPIFLLHVLIGAVCFVYFGIEKGAMLFVVSWVIIHILAWILHQIIKVKINHVRDKLRLSR